MGETLDYLEANAEGSELADFSDHDSMDYAPVVYKHPVCEGLRNKFINKHPTWKGKKRKCPCCGRMIWSRMQFSLHGDQRK